MPDTTTSTSNAATTAALLSSTLALVGATSALYYRSQLKRKAESEIFPGIPFAPGAHWLLGHMVLLNHKDDFVQGYRKVYEEHADPKTGLCSFWFLTEPAVNVLLGKHVKAVLGASSYRKSVSLLQCHNDNFLGPQALVTLMGKDWKRYRSAVHKSFTPAALKQSQGSILQVGNKLVQSLLEAIHKAPTDSLQQPVLPLMKMATMDVFGLAAMNIDFGCCAALELTPVAKAFEHLTQEYTRRLTTPWDPSASMYWLPTKTNQEHKAQRNVIRKFIADQIVQTRRSASTNNALLANILRTANVDGDDMTDDAIGDILMTLLFGGYDTTSITLTYALYLLAKNPEIQAECVKEVKTVFANHTDQVTPEQLPYTQAVVLETLRLYPPAPVTSRNLEKDMELSEGVIVPKGTMMLVPVWSVQRDERNYPRPLEVLVERWIRPSSAKSGAWEERPASDTDGNPSIAPANRDAFCVFSAGARNCVGKKLALQEAVTLLALLVKDLKFEAVEEVKPVLCSVVQQPDGGLNMRISARE